MQLRHRGKTRSLFAAIVALLAGACAASRTDPPEPAKDDVVVLFPPPPDTARIQFLTRITTASDVVPPDDPSFFDRLVGENQEEEPEKGISKPYGIAFHEGRIYVCDTKLGGLDVIDLAAPGFEYFIPPGEASFQSPVGVYVDDDGTLYVADADREQIVVFDSGGSYRGTIGAEELERPTDVAVHNGVVWVVDAKKKKVFAFDRQTRRLVLEFPDAEPGTAEAFGVPTHIAVWQDKIYVTDLGQAVVKIFSLQGEFLSTVGSHGDGIGQFARPKGIALDREGNLYVVDAVWENVQVFNPEGELLLFFGGAYRGPGYMYLPAKVIIDYDNIEYFQQYVDPRFDLKYLILVTNQFGPDKVSVYGFIGPTADSTSSN